ncbi:hypothetical protein LX36DRAFT_724059 [Colletotrichum falcatum]|nr:hypothetical protein LX36DRAFT_724059 [Colletotrichum falcatum]
MRYSLLFLAPAAVFGQTFFNGGDPATGPLCCNQGTADDSGTCKNMTLNAYACESTVKNNEGKGCDNEALELVPIGRDVKGFVAGSSQLVTLGPDSKNRFIAAFIGCAA